jgi:hypothetical protein
MSEFNNLDIKYTPLTIGNNLLNSSNTSNSNSPDIDAANEIIADKLLNHLSLISDFRDRLSAIDYLIDGASKLAGNPSYITNDKSIIRDISILGGNSNIVDFELFKKAVDIVTNGYKQMALIGLTGVAND